MQGAAVKISTAKCRSVQGNTAEVCDLSEDEEDPDEIAPSHVSLEEARKAAQTLAGFYQNNSDSYSADFQLKFLEQHVDKLNNRIVANLCNRRQTDISTFFGPARV